MALNNNYNGESVVKIDNLIENEEHVAFYAVSWHRGENATADLKIEEVWLEK